MNNIAIHHNNGAGGPGLNLDTFVIHPVGTYHGNGRARIYQTVHHFAVDTYRYEGDEPRRVRNQRMSNREPVNDYSLCLFKELEATGLEAAGRKSGAGRLPLGPLG